MSFTPILIAFLSIIVPGFFLAYALLYKTKLNLFEIITIGFIFGLLFPPALVWGEGYFMNTIHAFTFSAGLYNIDVIILTIIGVALCVWQGAFSNIKIPALGAKETTNLEGIKSDYKGRLTDLRKQMSSINVDMALIKAHEKEEEALVKKHGEEIRTLKEKGAGAEELARVSEAHKEEERNLADQHEREEKRLMSGEKPKEDKTTTYLIWGVLLLLMVITFASRIINIGVAPKYFEFDPYFDMLSTQQILVYGYQLKLDYSAWPVNTNGTVARIQPIIPYIEAYWYDLTNTAKNASSINTSLLSIVSSYYPPITAALLVFIVFMFVYHEYGGFPALIAAALTATMPTLITTFIAGEQLVEPWGIFALFFMVAAYSLAAKYPKEKRYAILAGIAFASNFLGAHYYNVTSAVLAVYILAQGVIDTLLHRSSIDFYKMNALMLLVIIIFYVVYAPYNATLTNRIPNFLGVPSIVAFPLFALVAAFVFEYLPTLLEKYKVLSKTRNNELFVRIGFIAAILIIALVSPLGKPITSFLALSSHFTTPSTALFMTVQEYVVTGLNFNFGSAGLGVIGESIGGLSVLIWVVLFLFSIFTLYEIFYKGSRSSIFTFVMVIVLAIAGFSEIKYLPHFGVGYIIAIGVILGELYIIIKERKKSMDWIGRYGIYAIYIIGVLAVIFELSSGSIIGAFTGYGMTCSQISKAGSVIASTMYCNTLTTQWLNALAWMRTNIGPLEPRILAWWDYGDWINWFGNSNAVIRGDNAVATLDYATAAHFVLASTGYNASSLAQFMDTTAQAKYVLFDDQLVPKWSALDFLACVDINQTSREYAISQGKLYSQPFLTGTSPCEISHDPVVIAIPEQPTINQYCSFSNSNIAAVQAITFVGETVPTLLNNTYCVSTTQNSQGLLSVYNPNGTRANIILTPTYYLGGISGPNNQVYLEFLAIYTPNGPNGTITDAPSQFYNSTYYQGFFLGRLPGFTLVYPKNFTGINMVNSTNTVMIFQLNNYTGTLPYVPPKPSWVHNNYTIPG